ncbi:MAG: DUF4339 domain-containing protein [Verrucomicrobia bacterium]|nr:DUF4339 domain-containing protein [Verrucomicrobiota bacterium]
MNIYVSKNGEVFGPFTDEQVRQSLHAGMFSANDLCWHEGRANWTPLGELAGVLPAGMPPLPTTMPPIAHFPAAFTAPQPEMLVSQPLISTIAPVDHSIAWVAAFVPLSGLILDAIFLSMGLSTWFATAIIIVINCLMLSADEKKLRALGFKTESLGSAWLIPVYLFKRVQVVGSGYGYAVCWMITFFVSFLHAL